MRERGVAFLLALAALLAFYGLWLRPAPSFDPDAGAARPTTLERRGNGYAAAFEWLQRSGIEARSFRERYTALADLDVAPRGNLLVLSLPGLAEFQNEEFAALDRWVRRGNTLLINAALLDQPGWGVGRAAVVMADIEALTAVEFETREAREQRLDETPLAQRVREADAREAKEAVGKDGEGDNSGADPDEVTEDDEPLSVPTTMELHATGPHPLLSGVSTLMLETDFKPGDTSLRLPYDNFVLTLARTDTGEGALFEQRIGAGRVLLSAAGGLFTNRALGKKDNARLFSNIVNTSVSPGGVVLFDDLRQGLSASYDPAKLYRDPRFYKTAFILLGLWLVWVLGSTRLRAPAIAVHDPSEAELVRRSGGLIARTVAPHRIALRLYDHFFARVALALRRSGLPFERGELWQWLERHAAILPQELDQLKIWYADARAERKIPLVPLQTLLDTLEKRLKT
jgi:hypothetical protein